jgi:hypothetical protein
LKNRYLTIAVVTPAALLMWGAADPNVEQNRVIEGMLREQAVRFEHFEGYSRLQHYSVTTDRFGLKAEMVARVHRDRIKGKTYEVISRSGSPVIQSHVFDALLEAEIATSQQGGELLTRENYTFHLVGKQEYNGLACYLLETEPKHKEKRLLKGRLWVDAEDFGVVHVEGRPTESLSFWVGRPVIVQDYVKQSGYWWASRRHSYIDNLWLGKSDLVIEYSDYQFDLRKAGDSPSPDAMMTPAKVVGAP